MSTKPKKRGRKKGDPDGQIKAAIQDGLSEDKSGIDSKPVHGELANDSKPQYAVMMDMWRACIANITNVVISSMDWILRSNPHPLQSLKADPYPMDLTYGQIHYRWIYRWIIQRFEAIRGCTEYFDKDSLLLRVALAPSAKAAREHRGSGSWHA
jgi:hypothetical protein